MRGSGTLGPFLGDYILPNTGLPASVGGERWTALLHLATALFGANCRGRIIHILDGNFTCHWDESGTDPGTESKAKSDTPLILVLRPHR
jgi:hypothetical protein